MKKAAFVAALIAASPLASYAQSLPSPQVGVPTGPNAATPRSYVDNAISGIVSAAKYGIKCDKVTDDTAALNAAFTALGGKGGVVLIPASALPCKISTGITLPSNVTLQGVGFHYWSGLDFTDPADWARNGSSIYCADTVNPCVTMNGVGSRVKGIHFVYNQPAPPNSGTWTPTTFPYTIAVNGSANYTAIEDVSITGATHCIRWDGPSTGVSGIASYMRNIYFNGCFNIGTRMANIDNTMTFDNLRYVNWWYADKAPVVAYMETNKVDWDFYYVANLQATNIEFYQSRLGMRYTNATVNSGFGAVTFGAANLQLTNISFNEVCQGIAAPTSGDLGSGTMTNVLAYKDTAVGACPVGPNVFFDFSSANSDWSITNLSVGYVQTLMDVGATSRVRVSGVDVQRYSAFSTGAVAFGVATGGVLTLLNTPVASIRPGTSAGAAIGASPSAGTSAGIAPINSGILGRGYTQLTNGDATFSGITEFYSATGARNGYIGRSTSSAGIAVASDVGTTTVAAGTGGIVQLTTPGGGQLQVNTVSSKSAIVIPAMPINCTGQAAGTLINNGGVVNICP